MACCDSCAKGDGCEGDKTAWRRIAPIGATSADEEPRVGRGLSLSGAPRDGVGFQLEPGSPAEVAWKLSLSTSEATVSQTYELGECNAVRVEIASFIISATAIAGTKVASITLESSIDRENWRPESSTAISDAGYATWAVRGISARFVRIRFLGGSDNTFKSVHAVTLTGTPGPRWAGRKTGAA
ncbi:MAG: hypothetical protein FD180_2537 [Planctomycetota bacterium]|nr:MAG: hypothetical protein FD180_2537 [Planctomycetota bacterium]